MLRKLSYFFIIALAFSCKEINNSSDLPDIITVLPDSIISDSTNTITESYHKVYALNFKDSINFNHEIKNNDSDYVYENDYNIIHDSIIIIVDSSCKSFHTDEFNVFEFPPPYPPKVLDSIFNKETKTYDYIYDSELMNNQFQELEEKVKVRRKTHFRTYPVFIYNYGKNPVTIQNAYDDRLYIIIEAKNKNEKWEPIEYMKQFSWICGTGHYDYNLNSERYILSSVKRYKGNFRTKLRLKFRNFDNTYYSNEYVDYVNDSQFKSEDIRKSIRKRFIGMDSLRREQKVRALFLD